MKLWNKCICFPTRKTLMVLVTLLISTLVIASVWSEKVEEIKEKSQPKEKMWVPTTEDIKTVCIK